MNNLDTLARLRLDDVRRDLIRHVANRNDMRAIERARAENAGRGGRRAKPAPSAGRRTAASQRPA